MKPANEAVTESTLWNIANHKTQLWLQDSTYPKWFPACASTLWQKCTKFWLHHYQQLR